MKCLCVSRTMTQCSLMGGVPLLYVSKGVCVTRTMTQCSLMGGVPLL